MFDGSPVFIRFRRYGQRFTQATSGGQGWWLVMAPGLALTLLALAILIWPELLAYLVAAVLLTIGLTLVGWGWQMRQAQQRWRNNGSIYYGEHRGPGAF
jgi:hypothetical protein